MRNHADAILGIQARVDLICAVPASAHARVPTQLMSVQPSNKLTTKIDPKIQQLPVQRDDRKHKIEKDSEYKEDDGSNPAHANRPSRSCQPPFPPGGAKTSRLMILPSVSRCQRRTCPRFRKRRVALAMMIR
jgi:hypothetical protein